MELHYIRIKSFKGLSDLDLNFSNRFRFHFDESEHLLKITETENFIEGFFSKNITNFSGIIGQNGVGKTSVLRYVMKYFGHGGSEFDAESIAVFYEKSKFYYFSSGEIKISKPNSKYTQKKISDFDSFKDSTTLVFLSNHFDPTSLYSFDSLKEQLGDTKNLSTNFLLSSDIQKRRTFKDAQQDNLPFNDHVNAFSAQEFIRIVRLLRWITTKDERNPFPARLPAYINLSLYFNEDSPNKDQYQALRENLQKYFTVSRSKRDQLLVNAFVAGVFHIADQGALTINPGASSFISQTIDRILEFIKDEEIKKKTPGSTLQKINGIIEHLMRNDRWRATFSRLDELKEFIRTLSFYLEKYDGHVNADATGLSVKLFKASIESLISLIEGFYSVDKIGDFAEFYFSHQPLGESSLSSGEYSLLSLFGRLNELKFDRGKKHLLFLIDEAELALHPAWQRRFIDVFSEFLTEKFKSQKLQVLITSHSPFILSDLPPHCVVLLRRFKDRPIAVDSLDTHKETFGANIHELFTDSFFLEDGLIGEFSRKKIEELITDIKAEKGSISVEKYRSKYQRRLDIIGELFLKTKISELIASKSELDVVDQVIEQRNRELEILNQIRKQKKDDQNRAS